MKIYLVRHGQSKANEDKVLHKTMADHAIPLSDLGKRQSHGAGYFLGQTFHKSYGLLPDLSPANCKYDIERMTHAVKNIRIWLSPYRRTRETASGIFQGYNQYQSEYGNLNVWMDQREDIRLCEQQFGLFDGIPDNERHLHYPAEAAHYAKCEEQEGHFWARMPLGESRFDVANRVHQTFGTFHRDNERHGFDTIIVVCHGVTLRAFVMQWLHLTPEWFNDEPNPGNCDIRLINNGHDEGYIYRGIMA